jgi:hypothetical protein
LRLGWLLVLLVAQRLFWVDSLGSLSLRRDGIANGAWEAAKCMNISFFSPDFRLLLRRPWFLLFVAMLRHSAFAQLLFLSCQVAIRPHQASHSHKSRDARSG